MTASLSQNQFAPVPIQGQMDLRYNPGTISAQLDATEVGTLVPGQAVKIYNSAGGVPKVVACAADSDDVFGFINYDLKQQTFTGGDRVELSAMRDSVMYMTASAAIARNAKVAVVIASKKIVTATTGMTIVGRALDKAAADGDLIRVFIDLPGATA